MAVYDLQHTAAQIDETVTKVLTTGEIAKMVRDEVKAQLSAITSGVASIPVFDSTAVMKLMTLANFAKAVGGQQMEALSTGNADNINYPCAIQISSSSISGWSNIPTNIAGILWMPFFLAGYWRVQFYLPQNSATKYFYVRTGSSSGYNPWYSTSAV